MRTVWSTAFEHDLFANGPRNERLNDSPDGGNPDNVPRVNLGIVEAACGPKAGSREARGRILDSAGPDILDGGAVENPSKMYLSLAFG